MKKKLIEFWEDNREPIIITTIITIIAYAALFYWS